MKTRYKNYDIIVENNYFDIAQGKQLLAVGINESPLERAKYLVDIDFVTPDLLLIRTLPVVSKNKD